MCFSAFHISVCCQSKEALGDGCVLISVAPNLRPACGSVTIPPQYQCAWRTTAWHTKWPTYLFLVRSCLQRSCNKHVSHCVLLLLTLCVRGPCRDAFGIEKSYRMPCPVLIHDDWAVAATPYHLHPRQALQPSCVPTCAGRWLVLPLHHMDAPSLVSLDSYVAEV